MTVSNRTPPGFLLWCLCCLLAAITLTSSHPFLYLRGTRNGYGRNIRPLPCVSKGGATGVCMFAWDCMKANGTHLGTCIDRFYFGSCCKMNDARPPPPPPSEITNVVQTGDNTLGPVLGMPGGVVMKPVMGVDDGNDVNIGGESEEIGTPGDSSTPITGQASTGQVSTDGGSQEDSQIEQTSEETSGFDQTSTGSQPSVGGLSPTDEQTTGIHQTSTEESISVDEESPDDQQTSIVDETSEESSAGNELKPGEDNEITGDEETPVIDETSPEGSSSGDKPRPAEGDESTFDEQTPVVDETYPEVSSSGDELMPGEDDESTSDNETSVVDETSPEDSGSGDELRPGEDDESTSDDGTLVVDETSPEESGSVDELRPGVDDESTSDDGTSIVDETSPEESGSGDELRPGEEDESTSDEQTLGVDETSTEMSTSGDELRPGEEDESTDDGQTTPLVDETSPEESTSDDELRPSEEDENTDVEQTTVIDETSLEESTSENELGPGENGESTIDEQTNVVDETSEESTTDDDELTPVEETSTVGEEIDGQTGSQGSMGGLPVTESGIEHVSQTERPDMGGIEIGITNTETTEVSTAVDPKPMESEITSPGITSGESSSTMEGVEISTELPAGEATSDTEDTSESPETQSTVPDIVSATPVSAPATDIPDIGITEEAQTTKAPGETTAFVSIDVETTPPPTIPEVVTISIDTTSSDSIDLEATSQTTIAPEFAAATLQPISPSESPVEEAITTFPSSISPTESTSVSVEPIGPIFPTFTIVPAAGDLEPEVTTFPPFFPVVDNQGGDNIPIVFPGSSSVTVKPEGDNLITHSTAATTMKPVTTAGVTESITEFTHVTEITEQPTIELTEAPTVTTTTDKMDISDSAEVTDEHDSAEVTEKPTATGLTEIPVVATTTEEIDEPITTIVTETPTTNLTDVTTVATITAMVDSSESTEEDEIMTTDPPSVISTEDTLVSRLNTSNYKDICGMPVYPTKRIVGGSEATFGEWPWQVSLRQWRQVTFLHKCGAALLNENWAITAAHCVENAQPEELLLRLGEFDLERSDEPYPFAERKVQIVATHPQFDARTFEYDLALLRFYEPVTFMPNVIPICVPQDDYDFIGDTGYVTGWGRLYEDGPLPSVMQKVPVPVITNEDCEAMYRVAGYVEHIPNIFICAGYEAGRKDSCEGDSGGPLVIQRDDGTWYLAGVISWGIGCALPNQPGVYTRISEFREWIEKIIVF